MKEYITMIKKNEKENVNKLKLIKIIRKTKIDKISI